MKWILFLLPISFVFGQSDLFLNVDCPEDEVLENIVFDPFVATKVEEFGAQELAIFEMDDKDVLLTFWSAEVVSNEFEDAFNFENPLCDIQPSLELVPEAQGPVLELSHIKP
jgi:hypothetical protein